ncbi:MAG: aminotransferase class V-fold PLP-dependent enzyme [Aliiglaciecola sp.]
MADTNQYYERFNLPQSPYFLSHSVGCISKLSESMLAQNFLEPWKTSGGNAWGPWLELIGEFDAALARLLDADPDDFCPQQNLSSGFTKFLMSLPKPSAKRNKVLIHPDAFPSMGFVINAMQKMGLELAYVQPSAPTQQLQMWEESLNDTIFCALITHVHSNTGHVSPVSEIVKLCARKNVYSTVDIAQSAGILPISLSSWNADAVFGSCVKWLCGGPGAGFIWTNPNILQRLRPSDVGWFSHEDPFEMDINSFEYAGTAKRFWGGTPSIAPYAIALGGIRCITEIGVENILDHNRVLMRRVLSNSESVASHAVDINHIGGTLCLPVKENLVNKLSEILNKQKIFFDQRKHVFRLSFHIYNNERECQALNDAFAQVSLN